MCAIKMKIEYKCSILELPYAFIDDYMTDCLPVYPLIYIWSLRHLLNGEVASLNEIGERFQLTEGDVIKAWRHWEKEKLVKVSTAKQGDEMEITFLPVKPRANRDTLPLTVLTLADKVFLSDEKPTSPQREKMPEYTPPELECYSSESPDVRRLFKCAEQTLGMLSHNEMNTVFGFYDWLRLPIDVIEYLLGYCAENDHRKLAYIEKCALDWADRGITSVVKAMDYVQNFDTDYRAILRHLGRSGNPTPAQRKFMDRWLYEWNMPLEMILMACDKCSVNTRNADFKYADKILSNWHGKGIVTEEAAYAADEEFSHETKQKSASRVPATKPKSNRFINFNQREIDFDKYEKLERAYRDNKYKAVVQE